MRECQWLLRALLPIRLAAPIEAPGSLLVVRYELPSVCLENPIHARWVEIRRSCRPIHTFNILTLTELFGSYCAMAWCIVSSHERNYRAIAPLKDAHMEEESRYIAASD
ncbi:hypothetical protein TNCV_2710581 [Trichonephila clavipes]|nr:hypothetical protein TNCV_2710581 [Trichonephila clavipes]